MGTGFTFGVVKCSGTREWWLHNIVNLRNAAQLYTLRRSNGEFFF